MEIGARKQDSDRLDRHSDTDGQADEAGTRLLPASQVSDHQTRFDCLTEAEGEVESRKQSIPNVPQQQPQQPQQHYHHHHHQQQSSNHFRRLIDACKQKKLETIKQILSQYPELINQRDRFNRNVLHYTVILFKKEKEDDLISQDSIDDFTDNNNEIIAQKDDVNAKINLDCLDYLLDRCQVKLWWQQDLDGLSILHLAVISSNVPLVKYIIYQHTYSNKYPLVNTLDNEHHSPLHWAVITNNLDCVKLLINSLAGGAKLVHEPDFNGATPLHYATQTNDYPKYRYQLRLLLKNVADSSDTNQSSENNLLNSDDVTKTIDQSVSYDVTQPRRLQHHNLEVLETLIKLPQVNIECLDKDRRTPMLWAASSGNKDAVLLLINNGANPLSCDINKLGALHCAASHGFTDCLECLLSIGKRGCSTTTSALIANEQSVNLPDSLNCTPLFYAVLSGNIDCVELLADRGAKLDWQDSKGRSAAHFASLKGQLNSLKLLHRRGANLWLPNRQGDLPLHYAIKGARHQVARWLLDHSPYENSVNAINNFGRAPIHLAIQRNDIEMLDHLIMRGANLNQLVKVKDRPKRQHPKMNKQQATSKDISDMAEKKSTKNGTEYHYETGLDLAKKLGYDAILRLLLENGAKSAAQVMINRMNGDIRPSNANLQSLFDLQTVDGPTPIGFETGSSSASPAQEAKLMGQRQSLGTLPKLSQPRTDPLIHSDSSRGSSVLSQTSMTSVRGMIQQELISEHHEPEMSDKPYKGGISYNNERINASIKCKFYDGNSFPPLDHNRDTSKSYKQQRTRMNRNQSAPSSGQEIITNVNVYTSPCPFAHSQKQLGSCSHCSGRNMNDQYDIRRDIVDQQDEEMTSEGLTTETSGDEANVDDQPWHRQQKQQQQLPNLDSSIRSMVTPQSRQTLFKAHSQLPSRGHEQQLPVILSDKEERSTSADTSNDRSPEVGSDYRGQQVRSPASEEPRFDRADRSRGALTIRSDRLREQVRSPVGDYIRAPIGQQPLIYKQANYYQPNFESHRQLPDYSQVKAKVDSHRDESSLRSKSLTRGQQQAGQGQDRSASRQTFIKDRRSSSDSFDLTLNVEKSIRKYKQEKRLFEELQGLKRSQIRSGRANEAILVKRLVEHFHQERMAGSNDLIGLDNYTGPYNYKSYERFLYDQLRKLSQSNCAKLTQSMRDFEQELRYDEARMSIVDDKQSDPQQERDYLEEDLRAEQELSRVIAQGGDESLQDHYDIQREEIKHEKQDERQQPEEIGIAQQVEKGHSEAEPGEPETRRSSIVSLGSLSHRSSIDVAVGKTTATVTFEESKPEGDQSDNVYEEATSLCSAIMTDVLGNVNSRSGSPAHQDGVIEAASEMARKESVDADIYHEEAPEIDEAKDTLAKRTGSRRKSVINIGNKMEVIYHDVAIEIDPASDRQELSEEEIESVKRPDSRQDEILVDKEPADVAREPEGLDGVEERDVEPKQFESDQRETEISVDHGSDLESSATLSTTEEVQAPARRASSPPNLVKDIEETEVIKIERRRLNSDDSSYAGTIAPKIGDFKKVFNGYDLDELHRRKKSSIATATKIPIEVRTKRPGRRKRRAISRIPSKIFEPRVNIEEIKRRWNQIKVLERERSKAIEGKAQVRYLTKSQPNIEQKVSEEEQLESRMSDRQDNDIGNMGNYRLLYEINTSFKLERELRMQSKWCNRKVAKIVDVRSLKRTLSLPDSLIYSNDLLKKFSILKL